MSLDKRFELLAYAVEIANSTVDIDERLENVIRAAWQYLGAKTSMLFMQDAGLGGFVRANCWPPGCLKDRKLPFDGIGEGELGQVMQNREPMHLMQPHQCKEPFLRALCTDSESVALFPVQDDNRLYAVLAFVLEGSNPLPSEDVRLLQMVSRELAGSIRNFRLYFEAKKRIAELYIISDLGRAAISTIDIDELLSTVASISAKFLGAAGSLVQVRDRHSRNGRMMASHGKIPEVCMSGDLCENFCDRSPQSRTNIQPRLCSVNDGIENLERGVCVRLNFKGDYQGHLCVFDKIPLPGRHGQGGFSGDDRNLLSTMAPMISPALENALAFQRIEDLAERNEEMVSELGTLFEISTFLMTTVDFNETVQIIMHAVTHPAGLDHDRVILFLLDEEKQLLRAVADKKRPSGNEGPVGELLYSLQKARERLPLPDSTWNYSQTGLEISLKPHDSVLARTVNEKKSILVEDPQDVAGVSPQLLDALGPNTFVTVPMFAKGKVVGVVVVNNGLDGRPFTDRDIKLLSMLANLGGLALENARLYQNLEHANHELAVMRNRLLEADKLAALGEIAAGVAHEIRNPLVSIGGFTRRIRKKIANDSDIRPYLDVIIEEVTRLERTLNEMLDFSTDSRESYEEHDLNRIMKDSLDLIKRELDDSGIKVVKHLSDSLPKVFCDDRQIKHVFFNLFLNAKQAMEPVGGTISLRTFTVVREGKQFVAGEVIDSGGGISLDVIHNIFNPFFTTKDTGTGLGLSIAHKIITRHFGQVEVHNHEGQGAGFLVTLPAAEEARAYLK